MDKLYELTRDGDDGDVETTLFVDACVEAAHRARRFAKGLGGFDQKPSSFGPSLLRYSPVA